MARRRSSKTQFKPKLSRATNSQKYPNYLKLIPLLCILAIFMLNSFKNSIILTDKPIQNQIVSLFLDFSNSFNFSDTTHIITTILILVTIWTGYKHWLVNHRIIRRNKKTTKQILFAVSIVVFSEHVIYNSIFGKLFDYFIFFVLLYIVFASTWLIAKIVDSFNLEQDLYCWGLRLVGIVLFFFGFLVFSSGTFVLAFNQATSSNIVWITGICLMLLGTFSEYRSFRRHGVFVYIR